MRRTGQERLVKLLACQGVNTAKESGAWRWVMQ